MKTERIEVRATPEIRKLIKRAAVEVEKSQGAFILEAAEREANKILARLRK